MAVCCVCVPPIPNVPPWGEGATLSCRPSADVVAGNGPDAPQSGHTDYPISTPTQSHQGVWASVTVVSHIASTLFRPHPDGRTFAHIICNNRRDAICKESDYACAGDQLRQLHTEVRAR